MLDQPKSGRLASQLVEVGGPREAVEQYCSRVTDARCSRAKRAILGRSTEETVSGRPPSMDYNEKLLNGFQATQKQSILLSSTGTTGNTQTFKRQASYKTTVPQHRNVLCAIKSVPIKIRSTHRAVNTVAVFLSTEDWPHPRTP